jgi:hypothetical protein
MVSSPAINSMLAFALAFLTVVGSSDAAAKVPVVIMVESYCPCSGAW